MLVGQAASGGEVEFFLSRWQDVSLELKLSNSNVLALCAIYAAES
jgi:hypothetical protein